MAAVTGQHQRAVLTRAMYRLTAPHRMVLWLRFYQDRDLAETADLLGLTVPAVKGLQRRATRELAKDKAVQALRQPPRDAHG